MAERVEDHLGLVNFIAQKYVNVLGNRIEFDDMLQEGAIGLFKATKAFNPEKNIKFSTFASICIHNQIKMFIRKQNKINVEFTKLDAPIVINSEESERITLLEMQKDMSPLPEEEIIVKDALERLVKEGEESKSFIDKRTKQYLFYFSKGMNQYDIAKKMNLSQSYVSRERTRLKRKLKSILNNQ